MAWTRNKPGGAAYNNPLAIISEILPRRRPTRTEPTQSLFMTLKCAYVEENRTHIQSFRQAETSRKSHVVVDHNPQTCPPVRFVSTNPEYGITMSGMSNTQHRTTSNSEPGGEWDCTMPSGARGPRPQPSSDRSLVNITAPNFQSYYYNRANYTTNLGRSSRQDRALV